jgi:mRNA interferase MazF
MPRFQLGEVVVTTFPFADKAGTKLRPALVLRDTGGDDLIIALISTSLARSAFDATLADWQQAGLAQQSIVRVDKLLTIAQSRLRGPVGSLTPRDWAQVRTRVKRLWASI